MAGQGAAKRANLRDVAQAAGVSVATVSRVLNTPSIVSADTLARVQSAIEALHFVPSAAARAINSGRTRMVGALVPTLDNAIFARFLAALEAGLARHDLSLVVATTGGCPDTEAEKAARLIDIGAEALIVSGVTHGEAFDALIRRTRLPAVATSYFDAGYALPTIGYDNAAAAALALGYLTGAGHREIAVLHGPDAQNDRTQARLAGLRAARGAARLHLFGGDLSMAGGTAAMRACRASGVAVTAVLCLSDVLAIAALFELQRQGVDVPGQVSVLGIDDLPASAFTVPRLSSVRLPVGRMGREVAGAVAAWIEHDARPAALLLESSLVIRDSTRAIG